MTGERYTLERFNREREEREAAERAEAEVRRERAEKAAAKAAWLQDGGTETTFERHWSASMRDDVRAERVKRIVAEREAEARANQRRISAI